FAPKSVELEYTNTLGVTILITLTVPAPHTFTVVGATVQINRGVGPALPIEVQISFDSDFSGNMSWIVEDFENQGYLTGFEGTDKLYDFNIGFPISYSANVLLRGSSILSALGDEDPKTLSWQNIIDKDIIRFKYLNPNSGSFIRITPSFTKRKIDTWYFDGTRYRNPNTGTFYDTLPQDVTLSNCEDENHYVTWQKELCLEYSPLVFRRQAPNVYLPADAYNSLLDRNDGLPGVFNVPIGSLAWEFNSTGTRVYSNDGVNVYYGNYDINSGVITLAGSFPLLNLMPGNVGAVNLSGCAVSLDTDREEYYV